MYYQLLFITLFYFMQLTKKNREAILLYLTQLTQADAERIAGLNSVGVSTVWRIWKHIREGQPVEVDNITLAIAQLALANKPVAQQFNKTIRQLSARKRRLAA